MRPMRRQPGGGGIQKSMRLRAPITSATAVVTPAAVGNYFNIFVSAFVEVPRGCCLTVSAKNISTQAINFANSNMIVERVA